MGAAGSERRDKGARKTAGVRTAHQVTAVVSAASASRARVRPAALVRRAPERPQAPAVDADDHRGEVTYERELAATGREARDLVSSTLSLRRLDAACAPCGRWSRCASRRWGRRAAPVRRPVGLRPPRHPANARPIRASHVDPRFAAVVRATAPTDEGDLTLTDQVGSLPAVTARLWPRW